MDQNARAPLSHGRPMWAKVVAGILVVLVLLALLVAFFPWDLMRGPVNRYVSEKTGRHFAITRKLDVKLGRTTRVVADGIEFANPDWAADPYLVKAESGEIDIRLWPLIAHRQFVLPLVQLRKPQLGLQVEPDGRRTWALGRDTGDRRNVPDIGALVVDEGSLHFIATKHEADIHTDFAIDGAQDMPLSFTAKGTWQKEPFTAKGRTGNVLYLSAPLQNPFPLEIDAAAGATTLRAHGAVASLATLEGADAVFDLKGKDLGDLYKFMGLVLPATPHYALHGNVSKQGEVWHMREIQGKLGNTDVAGELSFDRRQNVPHLAGNLKSNWLDFDDLAPIVGLPEQPRQPAPAQVVAQAERPKGLLGLHKTKPPKTEKPPRDPNRKVLPRTPLDLARLKAMNSEVRYAAKKVTNAGAVPLDRMAVNVRLRDGVLNLDDMNLGLASGTVTGHMHIDSHNNPAIVQVQLKARAIELSKLFRNVELTKTSFGRLYGDVELGGRGNNVAQMLASSSGNFALLMGKGQISALLMEIAGLDGAEIVKFLLEGKPNVPLHCAATAFDVRDGVMTSRALVLDTFQTVVYGEGTINFGTEVLDLYFRPYPKNPSILTLRSPLRLTGTLGAPKTGVDRTALAARAGAALALGAVNPLLALAATIETGPGKDADCAAVLREAARPNAAQEMGAAPARTAVNKSSAR